MKKKQLKTQQGPPVLSETRYNTVKLEGKPKRHPILPCLFLRAETH